MSRSATSLYGFCLVVFLGVARADTVIHVAPAGRRCRSGTAESRYGHWPEPATSSVRRKGRGAVPSRSSLPPALTLSPSRSSSGPEDSGSPARPVSYAASPGATAMLSGGVRLDLDWKSYKTGSCRPRFRESCRSSWTSSSSRAGGCRMARYPNYNPDARPFHGTAADAISPDRVRRWANPRGAYVHALHRHAWGDFHYRITGVDGRRRAQARRRLAEQPSMGMHERHRFVENVFEELDAPGEWFFDARKTQAVPRSADRRGPSRGGRRGRRHPAPRRVPGHSREKPVRFVSLSGMTLTHTARTFMDNKEPLLRSDWTIYRGGAVLFQGSRGLRSSRLRLRSGRRQCGLRQQRTTAESRSAAARSSGRAPNGVCFVGDPGAVRSPLVRVQPDAARER